MSVQSPKHELSFSPGFAARVMAGADAIRGRRHRMAGFGAAAALALSAGIASLFLPVRQPTPAPAPAVKNRSFELSGNAQADPLQFLFPDAAPVAQFADNYSEMSYGRQQRPGELLFADDAEDTGDF
jgi:hypothetical protein